MIAAARAPPIDVRLVEHKPQTHSLSCEVTAVRRAHAFTSFGSSGARGINGARRARPSNIAGDRTAPTGGSMRPLRDSRSVMWTTDTLERKRGCACRGLWPRIASGISSPGPDDVLKGRRRPTAHDGSFLHSGPRQGHRCPHRRAGAPGPPFCGDGMVGCLATAGELRAGREPCAHAARPSWIWRSTCSYCLAARHPYKFES